MQCHVYRIRQTRHTHDSNPDALKGRITDTDTDCVYAGCRRVCTKERTNLRETAVKLTTQIDDYGIDWPGACMCAIDFPTTTPGLYLPLNTHDNN